MINSNIHENQDTEGRFNLRRREIKSYKEMDDDNEEDDEFSITNKNKLKMKKLSKKDSINKASYKNLETNQLSPYEQLKNILSNEEIKVDTNDKHGGDIVIINLNNLEVENYGILISKIECLVINFPWDKYDFSIFVSK